MAQTNRVEWRKPCNEGEEMRAPITDKQLLEMMWERFPEIMKRGAEQPAQQEPVKPEPFGYFQYDIRLDAWVQNRINNKGVAFYTKEQK
jgi:hypothetical protein